MRTAVEVIKKEYPFYDEDIAQKDIELSGEGVQYMMKQYAKEVLEEAYGRCSETEDHRGEHCRYIQSLINEL